MITKKFEDEILAGSAVLNTKLKILKAAATSFSSIGYDGTTIREIATKAKVPHSSITYHFGNKKQLFETVLGNLFKETFEISKSFSINAATIDVIKEFKNYLFQIAQFYYQHPEFLLILNRESSNKNEPLKIIEKELKKLKALVRNHLEICQTLGALKNIPIDDLQLLFSGAFQSIFTSSDSPLYKLNSVQVNAKLKKHVEYVVLLIGA
ncbi:MAG: TetR/AcrR family transcriptional regulator [Crocinitomicaceae bacterium]|nr:TetR/AcrR family transcriptional regulator [Crocinitomicaceae bacterium]